MDPLNPITYFAETDARNKKIKFGIKAKDRLRHMYVIGKTGMGKSTLLENLAIQDIQNGEGLAVIDPHGSMAEKLLDYVPEHRIKDVLYFAPFDMEYPIAFNVMEDVAPDKRHLVVNGLMATFEKIWADAWSARMAYILQYAIIGLLEYPDSSLLGINKMLSDKEYRKKVVDNITDASAKSFWVDEFGKYTERFAAEATPAIQNKVGQFTSNALVRNIVGQSQSSFDIREMMDNKKILIINLSKGQVGELNARLLGSMLITKIYLAAMSRADKNEAELSKLPNFYLYVDEFQSFANKSFADILSEARKYKLNLTVAHQYIEQMEEEVRDAVFGNVGTMVTFRVGAFDAEVLEKEFAPVFTAEDLVNLGFTQIYLKLMIDGVSSQPFSATTMVPIARPEISFKQQVIDSSRKTFGRIRKDVEENIAKFYEDGRGAQPAPRGGNNEGGGQRFDSRDRRLDGNAGGNGGGQKNRNQGYSQEQFQPNKPPQPQVDFRPPLTPEMELEAPKSVMNTGKISEPAKIVVPIRPDSQHQVERIPFRDPAPIVTVQALNNNQNNIVPDPNKIAFMQAAETLKSRDKIQDSGFKNENIQNHESKIMNPESNKVSLSDLRPTHEKAKIPTKENISSLQQALASVLKSKEELDIIAKDRPSHKGLRGLQGREGEKKEKRTEAGRQTTVDTKQDEKAASKEYGLISNVEEPDQNAKDGPSQEKPSSKDYGLTSNDLHPKEVPEDVLRKLLQVEEPRVS